MSYTDGATTSTVAKPNPHVTLDGLADAMARMCARNFHEGPRLEEIGMTSRFESILRSKFAVQYVQNSALLMGVPFFIDDKLPKGVLARFYGAGKILLGEVVG